MIIELPDTVILILTFRSYTGKNRNLPNDIRRIFMGIDHPKKKASINFPKEVSKRMGINDVVIPIYFSLIKNPISLGMRRYENRARGAIIVYDVSALDIDKVINVMEEIIKEKEDLLKNFQSFDILAGKVLKSVEVDINE